MHACVHASACVRAHMRMCVPMCNIISYTLSAFTEKPLVKYWDEVLFKLNEILTHATLYDHVMTSK